MKKVQFRSVLLAMTGDGVKHAPAPAPADVGIANGAGSASRELSSFLTINGGSSSIRFALFDGEPARRILEGKVDRVGLSRTNLTFKVATGQSQDSLTIDPAAIVRRSLF